MKNLRDSLPSWIDSERAGAVGALKVRSLGVLIMFIGVSVVWFGL